MLWEYSLLILKESIRFWFSDSDFHPKNHESTLSKLSNQKMIKDTITRANCRVPEIIFSTMPNMASYIISLTIKKKYFLLDKLWHNLKIQKQSPY